MSKSDLLINLIKNYKVGNNYEADQIVEQLAQIEDSQKHHILANKLRNVLSATEESNDHKLLSPSFLQTKISDRVIDDLILPSPPAEPLESIALSQNTKKYIDTIIHEWNNRDHLISHSLSPRHKILFYGPPGCGKTMSACSIANELHLPIIFAKFDAIVSSYLGETSNNLMKLFEYANMNRCVLLIDEIDALAKSREDAHDVGELKRIVISLLQNIESFSENSLLIAATNHESILDFAIWRRFDTVVEFRLPTENERSTLYYTYLTKYKIAKPLEEALFIKLTKGFSGSDIADIIVNTARSLAVRNGNANKKTTEELLIKEIVSQHEHNAAISRGTNQEDAISRIAKILRKFDSKRYSYKNLERMTGIAKATIHYRLKGAKI